MQAVVVLGTETCSSRQDLSLFHPAPVNRHHCANRASVHLAGACDMDLNLMPTRLDGVLVNQDRPPLIGCNDIEDATVPEVD